MRLKDLTKAERKHLAETSPSGRVTLIDLKTNLKIQRKLQGDSPHKVCWDCWVIAHKLGIDLDCVARLALTLWATRQRLDKSPTRCESDVAPRDEG